MSEEQSPPQPAERRSFWTTFPGILTAVGGLIGAVAALITALSATGIFSPAPTATPLPPTPTATVMATAVPPSSTPEPPTTGAPAPTATPAPTLTPVNTSAPDAPLLADDFDDPASGWLVLVTDQDEKGYNQGTYRIAVYDADFASWGYPEPPGDFEDVVIEVDAHRVDGPEDNEYGVVARYQPDDSFYLFSISSTGHASIQKHIGDEWEYLAEWTPSPAVRLGGEINRLRVTCQGAKLRFFVNGQAVAEADDASFRSGNIGLLASASDIGGVVVAFDNLRVRALTAP